MSLVRQFLLNEFDSRVYESADEVVPIILKLFQPRSVVDVGCNKGIWLSVFERLGVKEILGVDGEWIEKKDLQISESKFQKYDLTKPLVISKVYDCAICLEVAEHLPRIATEVLIESLVNLSQVVYFSAAIPFQGGEKHVNEQWQSYWAEKFVVHDYVVVDCVRPLIWKNKKVNWWYRQNSMVYIKRSYLKRFPKLKYFLGNNLVLDVVHPELYLKLADYRSLPVSWMVRKLVKKGWNWLRPK